MVQLLGFQITRANDDREKPAEAKQAFTVPTPDDGTTTISAGGYFGQYLDMEVTAKNDVDLIKRYREVAQHPECDMAIEDIINEVIVSDERDASISLSLDKLNISDNLVLLGTSLAKKSASPRDKSNTLAVSLMEDFAAIFP